MKTVHTLFVCSLILGTPRIAQAQAKPDADVRTSVVQVFSTCREPNLLEPWTRKSPEKFSGAGVVIDGERILTNAHVVLYASEVFVQPHESGKKYAATIEGAAPGIDLAVLKLSDRSFFQTRPPLRMAAKLPQVKDAVSVYGYPIGGAGLSVTKGIISRIELAEYDETTTGLRMQVDAAVNPGNSGGPAVIDDRMVGLAFAKLDEGENIGYLIPVEEIEAFLADLRDGRYDGKPTMYESVQPVENPALRAKLQLPDDATGVLVTEPHGRGPTYPLRADDVILRVGDYAIDNDGMVRVNRDLRLPFLYMVPKLAVKDRVRLGVWRGGKPIAVDVPLRHQPNYVLHPLAGKYPSYFIYGPLVFSTATLEYVDALQPAPHKDKKKNGDTESAWDDLVARGNPLVTRFNDLAHFDGEELVVVTTMFPHKVGEGYEDPKHQVVRTVNGAAVKNLRHLVETLRDSTDPFVEFKFADKQAETIVFDRRQVAAATEDILSDNGIRQPCSPDLTELWRGKAASPKRP
jgi:S1-C subfamily serine protease